MYAIGTNDKVVEIRDVPQSSVGAPCPMVLADEFQVSLVYYAESPAANRDGTTVKGGEPRTTTESVLWVEFRGPLSHILGPPNDEAFSGHPLADRGLEPYGVFEVQSSSWLRTLTRMNSVHPSHRDEHFADYRHFVFSFHDSVFECIAESFKWEWRNGSVRSVIAELSEADRKPGKAPGDVGQDDQH